jgi:arsenate reductase
MIASDTASHEHILPDETSVASGERGSPSMTDRVYNVLFLCTGNTARSILAESILRKDGAGRFDAFSAGSHPKGVVNPFALKTLADHDYPVEGLRSKSWDEFAAPGGPNMDFVFTVCDNAAGEACPFWPGHPMTAHWGVEDPAAAQGTDIEKERAFALAFRYLRNRISQFTALPIKSLDKLSLTNRLNGIGEIEGATHSPRQAD